MSCDVSRCLHPHSSFYKAQSLFNPISGRTPEELAYQWLHESTTTVTL